MSLLRTDNFRVPGKVVIDAAGANVHLFSSSGISVNLLEEVTAISTNRGGNYDETPIGRMVEVKMTPTQFTAEALAALFTHGSVRMGGSIVPATDKTLDIHTVDGVRRRIPCAFVFAEPAMTCKTGSTVLGEVTWRGIIPLNGDPSLLASFYSKSVVAWEETEWDEANELTPGWNFSWEQGAPSKWDDIDTSGGVTVTPSSTLDEIRSDRDGLKNVLIRDYSVRVQANCLNISEDLVLAATGWNGMKLGAKKAATLGKTLKLKSTTDDAFIHIQRAVLQNPWDLAFDASRMVVDQLTWLSRPPLGTAHMVVSTEDPDAPEEP